MPQEPQDLKEPLVHKDLMVLQVPLAYMEAQDHRAQQDHKDHKDHKATLVPLEPAD